LSNFINRPKWPRLVNNKPKKKKWKRNSRDITMICKPSWNPEINGTQAQAITLAVILRLVLTILKTRMERLQMLQIL